MNENTNQILPPTNQTPKIEASNTVFQPLEPNSVKNLNSTATASFKNINFALQKNNDITDYKTKQHPLEFYALGKVGKKPEYSTFFDSNKGIRSTSNDILQRNVLSIRNSKFDDLKDSYKKISVINNQSIPENNYLQPITAFNTFQKYNLKPYLTNHETFNITKEKLFASDLYSTVRAGKRVTRNEFVELKNKLIGINNNNNFGTNNNFTRYHANSTKQLEDKNFMKNQNKSYDCYRSRKELSKEISKEISKDNDFAETARASAGASIDVSSINSENMKKKIKTGPIFKDPTDYSKKVLKPNKLYFDKNNQQILRHKKWYVANKITGKTAISPNAPEWFNVVPEWKQKQFDEYLIKNEDTLRIFSRYQNWITVNPKTKDRRHPLEKIVATNLEATSKIMPKWMEIEHKGNKGKEVFRSVEYYNPLKQKPKKMMAFVDKDLNPKKKKDDYNPERSIFCYNDFRNNVNTKKQAEIEDRKVSQLPKKFFDWDDGKKFNPKYKKDI